MKKTTLLTRLMAVTLFAAMMIPGCKKETSHNELSPQEEEAAATYSTESETELEVSFNDVFDNVLGVNTEVGLSGTGVFGRLDSLARCFTVTVTRLSTTSAFPVRIVTDFGTTGCVGKDGRTRYGKIITTYSGRMIIPGSTATTTFDGYRINDLTIRGTHEVANTTAAGSNQRQFTVTISNARVGHPNGDYSEWNSLRVITQVEGNGTPDLAIDDVFTITGNGNGKVKHGNDLFAWRSEITEPLRKRFACRWITSGILKVRRESLSTSSQWVAVLNYGAGTCDNVANLTINGNSRQITLQ